jgi:HemY protein
MWRLLFVLLIVAGIATGFAYLADQSDGFAVDLLGRQIGTITNQGVLVFAVVLLIAALLGAVLAFIFGRPHAIRRYFRRRTRDRGHQALARGMIAVDVGDRDLAQQFASSAQKAVPNDPLTSLLRVKAAQLHDDHRTARKVLEDMTKSPETELAALHGLYLEAKGDGETEAARQFAERAMKANPRLAWSTDALFEIQCRTGDWEGAQETLATAERHHHRVDRKSVHRARAVLLTAQAMAAERGAPDESLEFALQAHKLAPELVPAAAIAGHLLSSKDSPRHAARVISKTWRLSPHPELAMAYAHIRPGESPQERLVRVQKLADMAKGSIEGPIAVANAAIEAREWQTAREALAPYFEKRPPVRICTAMARIEEGVGYTGRSREWLSRALRAPRDPAWTADGVVSKHWAPISPVTGELDAFEWKVPLQIFDPLEAPLTIDEPEGLLAAPDAEPPDLSAELDGDGSSQSPIADAGLATEETMDLPPEKAIDLEAVTATDEEDGAKAEADAVQGNQGQDSAPAPDQPETKAGSGEDVKDLDPLGGPPDRAA